MNMYIWTKELWFLESIIKNIMANWETLIVHTKAIRNEISKLGPSSNEVVSEKLIEIGKNLDTCFHKLTKLNFEEKNPDVLFASATELEKYRKDRAHVPLIEEHLVEDLASDSSKLYKHHMKLPRSAFIDRAHLAPPGLQE